MSTASSDNDQRKALQALFSQRLPSRIKPLYVTWGSCLEQGWPEETAIALQQRVERLAASVESPEDLIIRQHLDNLNSILKEILTSQQAPTEAHIQQVLACFNVLDVQTDERGKAPDPTDALPPKKGRQTVLVVLDDEALAHDLSKQLQPFGYQIETINSLESLKKALENDPLAVILDAKLCGPAGEQINFIKNLQPSNGMKIPFIFISDRDDLSVRLTCVRAGGDAFYLKPIEISNIIERLDVDTQQVAAAPYRVLILEDSRTHASFIESTLQKAGMMTDVVSDPMQVTRSLVDFQPEIILMDLYMPHCSGIELAKVIRQQEAYVGIPIMYLSAENDVKKQMDALSLGGDDFLTKPIQPNHLITAVRSRGQRSRSMRSLMDRDSLTGLLNHTRSLDQLDVERTRAARQKTVLSFAMIDIDHFKHVNDTYGHPIGDRVIKALSRLLKQRLRRTDSIGRYGGEEFAVILPNTPAPIAAKIMNEIRESFNKIVHHGADGSEFHVSFSCGVADSLSAPESMTVELLCGNADKALYSAKTNGRNQVVVAE